MIRISTAERRARIGLRHGFATHAGSVEAAAHAVVGFHSSDPVSVYLSALARYPDLAIAHVDAALYDRRSLLRVHGMRRTLFVVDRTTASVMHAACTRSYLPAERRRLIGWLEGQGVAKDGGRWIDRTAKRVMDTLAETGEATAAELTGAIPALRAKLTFGEGKTWGGEVGVSTRILFLMAAAGTIARARPRGSWMSGQYRWTSLEAWLGTALPELDPVAASADLLRQYLSRFGPATLVDISWWAGWTQRQTKAALEAVGAAEVRLDGGTGYVLEDDPAPSGPAEPWVRLLPSLDPTIMGWKERDWYLGPHAQLLFDRNGNAGHTVWADGRVIGGWGQTSGGELRVKLLTKVDRATSRRLEDERERLRAWLGDDRPIPRFRSPLEKELSA